MSDSVTIVRLDECSQKDRIHGPHQWTKSFLGLSTTTYRCLGLSSKMFHMDRVLAEGSAGTLSQKQIDRYLAGLDPFNDPTPAEVLIQEQNRLVEKLAENLGIPADLLRTGLKDMIERDK